MGRIFALAVLAGVACRPLAGQAPSVKGPDEPPQPHPHGGVEVMYVAPVWNVEANY
jgi:hypothetical protein